MKCIYLSTNGRALAEDVSPNCRLIEEPDGIHPIRPDNIWRSDRGAAASWGPDDSICIVFQGAAYPETWGDGLTKTLVRDELVDDLILKLHDRKQAISKVFWRRLGNGIATGFMLFMAGGIIAISSVMAYAVAVVLIT